jgi:CDP-diacylglycerol pyrophosphatase
MNTGKSDYVEQTKPGHRVIAFWGLAIAMAIIACAPFLLFAADQPQRDLQLPPNTLWEVVHNICVPGQSEHHDPSPCLQVNLTGGTQSGFAILRDPRGGTQFLLVPTARISGIESPAIRGSSALNYFDIAWESRTLIDEALHQSLPRDDIGLAINSAVSRSQDQMHIHFSCIRADVFEALRKDEGRIGDKWVPLSVPLLGHRYIAMWVSGEHLSPNNPFNFLAERLSGAIPDMANRTLVVAGFTRADGSKGFVILADRVNEQSGDLANGEELLDHDCHIATVGKKNNITPKEAGRTS